jgi:hypothetical protein
MVAMTDPTASTAAPNPAATNPGAALPPDPELYDEPRNVMARRKGLEQPYIVGGEDPEIEQTLAKERPYVRLLVGMIAVLVAMGFVLGIIGAIIGAPVS